MSSLDEAPVPDGVSHCTGTKVGLPELQLGILPGFGGTQRLPRLVGLQTAAQMMLTSAPINDKKAAKLGLVDGVVPKEKLLAAARAWAAEIAAGTKPRNFSLYRCCPTAFCLPGWPGCFTQEGACPRTYSRFWVWRQWIFRLEFVRRGLVLVL